MSNKLRESESRAVFKSLESSYCPKAIQEARDRQDEILIARFHGRRCAIADVGCGTGYHGSIFAPACELYHGFEISAHIGKIAQDRWRNDGLTNATLFWATVAEAGRRQRDFLRSGLLFVLYARQFSRTVLGFEPL